MLRSLLSLKVEFSLLFLLLKFNSQQNATNNWRGMGHKRKGTKSSNDLSGGLSLFQEVFRPLYLGHVCPSLLDFNPPKRRQKQLQAKEGSFGFQVFTYITYVSVSWTQTFLTLRISWMCFFFEVPEGDHELGKAPLQAGAVVKHPPVGRRFASKSRKLPSWTHHPVVDRIIYTPEI